MVMKPEGAVWDIDCAGIVGGERAGVPAPTTGTCHPRSPETLVCLLKVSFTIGGPLRDLEAARADVTITAPLGRIWLPTDVCELA